MVEEMFTVTVIAVVVPLLFVKLKALLIPLITTEVPLLSSAETVELKEAIINKHIRICFATLNFVNYYTSFNSTI